MSNTSSGVILISLLILSIAKPLSLLWFIVDLKYVFMRFNKLNDRSEVAVVNIFNKHLILGNIYYADL